MYLLWSTLNAGSQPLIHVYVLRFLPPDTSKDKLVSRLGVETKVVVADGCAMFGQNCGSRAPGLPQSVPSSEAWWWLRLLGEVVALDIFLPTNLWGIRVSIVLPSSGDVHGMTRRGVLFVDMKTDPAFPWALGRAAPLHRRNHDNSH